MGATSPILTTRQMRAVEMAAIASGVETGGSLMERAGAAAAQVLAARWPGFAASGQVALILCGPGNNGGDGYVIARHLAGCGWSVRVAALAPPTTSEAQGAAQLWRGDVSEIGAVSAMPEQRIGLCIDALFGTGISRPLDAELAGLLRGIAASGCPIVAVDILSGICADSGRVLGDRVLPAAELTVTFHRRKLGHVLAEGGELGGSVTCCDIGLEPWRDAAGQAILSAGPDPRLAKRAGHKYSHGHALILGGGPGRGGAARLAARAALRIGAGLVSLAVPAEAMPENAARLDAIMLEALAEEEGLARRLRDPRITALCLGPGLGLDRAARLVPTALAAKRATVLDADGLTAFTEAPERLFGQLHDRVLLTPHDGEFARLFPDLARRLQDAPARGPAYSRLDAARQAAARTGATVLLKGPDTIIAAPDGQAAIAAATGDEAAPWLATAGSGDVLAGLVAGLMARGFPVPDAARTGAWLHAEAARRFGPGLIAEDLPDTLPAVLRDLGA